MNPFLFLKFFMSFGIPVRARCLSTVSGGIVNVPETKLSGVSFVLLPETPEVFSTWLELVTTQQVSGKQVHDARLAASLKAHGVETLLTLNGGDFRRFDISVVHPREVQK